MTIKQLTGASWCGYTAKHAFGSRSATTTGAVAAIERRRLYAMPCNSGLTGNPSSARFFRGLSTPWPLA